MSFQARQTKWEILLGLCAFTRPPTLIIIWKMFHYVDFKRYTVKGFLKKSQEYLSLHDIWSVNSFFQIRCKIERCFDIQSMLSLELRTALW